MTARGGPAGPRGLLYVAAMLVALMLVAVVGQATGWGQPAEIPAAQQVKVDAEVLEYDPMPYDRYNGCSTGDGAYEVVCGHHLVRYSVDGREYRARLDVRGTYRFDGDGVRPVVYDRRDPSVVVAGDLPSGGRRGWGELVPMVLTVTAFAGVLVALYLLARRRAGALSDPAAGGAP